MWTPKDQRSLPCGNVFKKSMIPAHQGTLKTDSSTRRLSQKSYLERQRTQNQGRPFREAIDVETNSQPQAHLKGLYTENKQVLYKSNKKQIFY